MKEHDKKKCKRCGRTDLEVLSNELCTRCDDVAYGKPTPDFVGEKKWTMHHGGLWE